MEFTVEYCLNGERRYILALYGSDLLNARCLDETDKRLFLKCEKSSTVSDKLLALARLARLIEQGE